MEGPVSKLFQRKLYSWLSSKRGLPICILGLLILAISAFQFGEVLLEWSKERYAAQFSIYHDNIAGISFEKYMTPELPIDIVYTWVNGSDPRLLAELNKLKKLLADKEEKSQKKNAVNATGNITKIAHPTVSQCPFKRCVPWKTLIIDATNLSSFHTISTFGQLFPSLKDNMIDIVYLNTTGKHSSPVYGVQMSNEDKVSSYLLSPMLTTSNGTNISITRGFLTSDVSLVGGVPINNHLIITSSILYPANSSLHDSLVKKLKSLDIGNIHEVHVITRGVGVVFITDINREQLLGNLNSTFLNTSLQLHFVHAVWLPFTLDQNIESKNDIISSNRFHDNEELRYSLRSIEKYAPWVRHIYIVTNGQIPHWINLDNPRLTVVPHEDIYINKSHLPSYSSPSIESHLHRIPGLSKWFLYLNDDVLFGHEVWPHDFFTPDGGQKVYLSWAVPNCNEGCPPNWINDKYCDKACNVSSCDWDGDDCKNATRPGPIGGYRGHSTYGVQRSTDYCHTGCLNTWVGDRYCDNACNVFTCGYDAGDCGTEKLHELYNIQMTSFTAANTTYNIPLETTAMYFNLSSIYGNSSITVATHTPSLIIRTAVIAQRYKILSLTFTNNVSGNSTHFSITGKVNQMTIKVEFIVIADTATRNATLVASKEGAAGRWSFPSFENTTQSKFINEISVRIQDHDETINSWITEKPTVSLTPPILSTLLNYTVSNVSLLPHNIASSFTELEQEWIEGDLTERGYLKKKALLLQPYSYLPVIHAEAINSNKSSKNSNNSKNSNMDYVTKNSNTGHPSYARSELSHKPHKGGQRSLLSLSATSWLPWERQGIFMPEKDHIYDTPTRKGRRLLDTFADSLRYVNMLYTKEYGNQARKVPAHMPHMINKEVMEELQTKYAVQFDLTSSHKLRHAHDMQFSFSYFYYIIGEKETIPLKEIFERLDTDKSKILSVRELRTLLVLIMDIPLTSTKIDNFENMLKQCSQSYNYSQPLIDPLEYETHYDPELPLVTIEFLGNCTELIKKINKTFGTRNKFKYKETGEDHVQFKMLTQNSSKVLTKLDEVRKKQSKFICLNDNLDHTREDTRLAAMILVDFYESLFPLHSQFELPPNYRNKFLYVEDLRKWSYKRWTMRLVLQVTCFSLVFLCFVSLFYGKIVKLKRRITRCILNCFHSNRPGRVSTV